jgi:DNA-binding NarL/FixJ family response regulator
VRVLSTALSSGQPSVVIADDSAVAREGLVAIIRRDLGYTVCGLAIDERTTRELAEKHQPDLLVIEPFLGHHDGIFLLKELAARFPRVRILAVSRQREEIYAERALRAGASGYWMKTSTREELIRALDTILGGELYVSPRIALRAVHEIVDRRATHPKGPNLTDRELHVFSLIGAGFGTRRIAQELGISPKTVETYHEHIKLKLDTSTLVPSTKARANGSVTPKGNSGKTPIPQSGMTTAKYPGQSPIVGRTRQLLISSDRIEEERFQTKR